MLASPFSLAQPCLTIHPHWSLNSRELRFSLCFSFFSSMAEVSAKVSLGTSGKFAFLSSFLGKPTLLPRLSLAGSVQKNQVWGGGLFVIRISELNQLIPKSFFSPHSLILFMLRDFRWFHSLFNDEDGDCLEILSFLCASEL